MESLGLRNFFYSMFALLAVVTLLAGAIFYRVVYFSDNPVAGFWEIFLWQFVSWFPWVLIFAVFSLPKGKIVRQGIQRWNIPSHIVAAFTVAALNVLWFKWFSENFSPFLGVENTRYGVFQWFFIFWFFFNLFLYWGSAFYFGLVRGINERTFSSKIEKHLVVKTGKVSEVIKPSEVFWIEAQDYYSVLHLKDSRSWIKKTMRDLENNLDTESFVRVHRSTIINIHFLKQIEKGPTGKNFAIMKDGAKRSMSRQGWRSLKKVLKTAK